MYRPFHVIVLPRFLCPEEAGLEVKAGQVVHHMAEALIEDFGYDTLAEPATKPLEGIKYSRLCRLPGQSPVCYLRRILLRPPHFWVLP